MEIRNEIRDRKTRAVIFDFDGTISTLRSGWELVMAPMMAEMLTSCPEAPSENEINKLVSAFIDESTGIQTIFQMKWLSEKVAAFGGNALDPWEYKAMYNTRLMENVEKKKDGLLSGKYNPQEYLMDGAKAFLTALKRRGIKLYAASGTDDCDVKAEAKALGVYGLFDEIAGAPEHCENCSKEATLKRLIDKEGLPGECICVIGDGKVEIALGKAAGALTVGIASNEEKRCGINEIKRARLVNAGADVITGDFADCEALLGLLGVSEPCYEALDTSGITLYSAANRHNLVNIEGMLEPGVYHAEVNDPDFAELAERISAARRNGRPVIWSQGAHVIKNSLSRFLIGLMRKGIITHLAGNGACSIHDFELAYLGGTSEDVPTAIEDGSFGMWEETLRMMNEALIEGARSGWGYGEALAKYISAHKDLFPYRDDCVLYQAYLLGTPATYHIALGTDIIHQYPGADFAAIGACTGVDFKRICKSVADLNGGVYLNFGSAVVGPEVFLKALSISRNLGYQTFDITTANFDLIDLGDAHAPFKGNKYDDPLYYYRPRKNIVNRPVATDPHARGWHFRLDHKVSIPCLYDELVKKGW